MTDKPWTEEDVEAVTKLLVLPYQDQRDAEAILSLLHSRGMLKEKNWENVKFPIKPPFLQAKTNNDEAHTVRFLPGND